MPWYQFVWTEHNLRHLAENNVTPEQFEEVLMHSERREWSRSTGRPATRGYDERGRLLFCVYELFAENVVYPITAFEISDVD
jgi:hypothetical protein